LADHSRRSRDEPSVQLQLPVSARHLCTDARRGELDQPTDVAGGDEVPGRAEDMRAQNVAVCIRALHVAGAESTRPQTDRPTRNRVFLRLHGAEPIELVARGTQRWARQARVAEAELAEAIGRYG